MSPSARLVAITKPLVPDCRTAGEFIVYAARVSNSANQANRETDERLIRYLLRNKHWSPFEMVSATVEIATTRDIARQLLRHRSFSFQEFSQRYALVESDPILRAARTQHPTNRQASVEVDEHSYLAWAWKERQEHIADAVQAAYAWAIENGVAKEVARAVLPEGLTPSTLYVAGTFRSWLHYLDVRTEAGTQKEHRELAEAIRATLAEHEPLIFGAADGDP